MIVRVFPGTLLISMDLKEVSILGDTIGAHWYYQSKAAALLRLLAGRPIQQILDVGAGSAFFSRLLLEQTSAQSATCVDIHYPEERDENWHGKRIAYRRSLLSGDHNFVMLMDVLEHVEDDVGLLKQTIDCVPSGAWFILSVPAFQFMWSEHDEFVEHKRRYTLPQLEAVARQAGLRIEQGCYFYALVFPLAYLLRVPGRLLRRKGPPQSHLKPHHPIVNALLGGLCHLELPFMHRNRLGGLTAFCLCRKP